MHNHPVNISDLSKEFVHFPIGRRIRHEQEIPSTNSLALEELKLGRASHGDIFVADRQSSGRGQSGRDWQSETDDGLWMTIVLMMDTPPQPLSFLPCLAVHDYLNTELGLPAHLKWPNDILVGSKKIAGILVEATTSNDNKPGWVIGIGLNLNRRVFADPIKDRATSIVLERGSCPDRLSVLRGIIQRFNHWMLSDENLVSAWTSRSRMPGRSLIIRRKDKTYEAQVVGLSDEGYLQLELEDGRIETVISSSDIELPLVY